MKDGSGICDRSNVGPEYVCKHGPVFTLAQLNQLSRGNIDALSMASQGHFR
jgi:sulfhydrogenase subunit gamma (sulfur reductase)